MYTSIVGFHLGDHITFTHLGYLIYLYSWLGPFQRHSLFLITLTVLRNNISYVFFVKCPSIRACLEFFSRLVSTYIFWRGSSKGKMEFPSHQIRSVAQSCPTVCNPMNHSTSGLPVHHQLPEFNQTHIHRVSDAIQPSHPLSSNESTLCMRWPKYWSFSFGISPSKKIPGLISFRMDWLDLLAVQGTLKSLLQHHSSKVSILWCSAFYTVQLSHPYMTTGITIALTRQTFIGKVMSLLLNMLSRLV